jgi:hypothetical protein
MRASIRAGFCAVVALVALIATASPAHAESPWWHLISGSRPANLAPGESNGQLIVTAENMGDANVAASSQPVHILDTLPAGLKATKVIGITGPASDAAAVIPCSLVSDSLVSCTFSGSESELPYEFWDGGLPPYRQLEMRIDVTVEPTASSGALNEVSISGGEAPSDSISRPVTISSQPTRFGVENYEMTSEEAGGLPDTQAGSHPFQTSFTFAMNQLVPNENLEEKSGFFLPNVFAAGATKDLRFKLPPGFVGDPSAIPQCSVEDFLHIFYGENACGPETAVGVARVGAYINGSIGYNVMTVPLFNITPSEGEPARFAFWLPLAGFGVFIDTSVRTGGDYGVTSSTSNISQIASFLWSSVTFWGTPGDSRHNRDRGWSCLSGGTSCATSPVVHPPPLLDLPTSCAGPLQTSLEADSWDEAGRYTPPFIASGTPSLDGCNRLPFAPEIKVMPDGGEASKPTGLTVDVHVPQGGELNGKGLADSTIKDITVKLPLGVAINPSSGDGLQACSADADTLPSGVLGSLGDEVGYEGEREFDPITEPGVVLPAFTRYLPDSFDAVGAGFGEAFQPGVDFCPDASKVAMATIRTPLLPNPLVGSVYLAAQESNPFDSVLAMYLVAEDPVSGSLVKLPGEVQLCRAAGEVIAGMTCETVGQLISTFEETPQLPFEDAELHFFGGERAPLATPSRCGTYTTDASYVPWSGSAPASSMSSFEITSGPNHGKCVYAGEALPFSPTLTGGALSVNAGWFSPFDATFSRLPGEQNMQSIEVHLPPGLSGILTGVELCPEPQANLGACSPNSLIGETTVGVGVGGDPYTVSGGKFYLTGPYNGRGACTVGEPGCAPFGITFTVPAKAGPFDFADTKNNHPACDCVLVRGKVEVNPITAAITITSNPPGAPDSIPTSLEGIPLEIQHVNAVTTRTDFQFNPTNCNRMEVTGTIHSSEGATDALGVPFQVTNCAVLAFKPGFSVSTSGKTSRASGASLSVRLTYPKAPFGTQANIKSVKVDLPKQLPSRLTTLQKACTAKQFEANPAGCPAASIVGHATAITPLIPVPLTGPAYFVSYGGAKFPELVIVLQGYGVTLDVHGETFISKAGITSSTFHTIPDAPVGSFELNLPEGPYSALAANGNLCKSKLAMPTAFVAQNGMEIHESTKIGVTGCAKVKKAKKSSKRHKGKSHGKKK